MVGAVNGVDVVGVFCGVGVVSVVGVVVKLCGW